MGLEKFEEEDELTPRQKQLATIKSIVNYAMGAAFILLGICLIFKLTGMGIYFNAKYDSTTAKVFGGVTVIYGIFRIYRGYAQNYFKD
jgi:NADH:ubiquinone oxidoreductase subunit 2 (subunit N)